MNTKNYAISLAALTISLASVACGGQEPLYPVDTAPQTENLDDRLVLSNPPPSYQFTMLDPVGRVYQIQNERIEVIVQNPKGGSRIITAQAGGVPVFEQVLSEDGKLEHMAIRTVSLVDVPREVPRNQEIVEDFMICRNSKLYCYADLSKALKHLEMKNPELYQQMGIEGWDERLHELLQR